jgi:hypothetical protein
VILPPLQEYLMQQLRTSVLSRSIDLNPPKMLRDGRLAALVKLSRGDS